jgi:hypothetical protein
MFMDEKALIISNEETLKTNINALKSILNEMCSTINGPWVNIETLTVSRQLDDLIVEYTLLKNNIL